MECDREYTDALQDTIERFPKLKKESAWRDIVPYLVKPKDPAGDGQIALSSTPSKGFAPTEQLEETKSVATGSASTGSVSQPQSVGSVKGTKLLFDRFARRTAENGLVKAETVRSLQTRNPQEGGDVPERSSILEQSEKVYEAIKRIMSDEQSVASKVPVRSRFRHDEAPSFGPLTQCKSSTVQDSTRRQAASTQSSKVVPSTEGIQTGCSSDELSVCAASITFPPSAIDKVRKGSVKGDCKVELGKGFSSKTLTASDSGSAKKISQSLLCDICNKLVGPEIFTCRIGHKFCLRCSRSVTWCLKCSTGEAIRRNAYGEQLYKTIPLPCRYLSNGCLVRMTFDALALHETDCNHQPMPCAVDQCGARLSSKPSEVLRHVTKDHAGAVHTHHSVLDKELTGQDATDVLVAHDRAFCVRSGVWDGKLSVTVMLYGSRVESSEFKARLTLDGRASVEAVGHVMSMIEKKLIEATKMTSFNFCRDTKTSGEPGPSVHFRMEIFDQNDGN